MYTKHFALTQYPFKKELGVDDMKLMILLETAGEPLYEKLASMVSDEESAKLLRMNGREETAHAHRLKQAIELLTGESYEIPGLEGRIVAFLTDTAADLAPRLQLRPAEVASLAAIGFGLLVAFRPCRFVPDVEAAGLRGQEVVLDVVDTGRVHELGGAAAEIARRSRFMGPGRHGEGRRREQADPDCLDGG